MNVNLVVLDGKHAGRRIELPLTQFVIGRDPRCHLRPASSGVSRFHCAIAIHGGQVHVRDLKSRNGTFVNDRRLAGSVRLHPADVLRVGPLRFEIQIQSEDPPTRSVEQGLGWLVRSPDALETAALDPSARTIAATNSATSAPATPVATRSWRVDQTHEVGGAIAGDYLREYLNRRGTRQV